MPFPIAAAWQHVLAASEHRERTQRLVSAGEAVLRTTTVVLLADFLRGSTRDRGVDAEASKLVRPSLGVWSRLAGELARALMERSARGGLPPFAPPLCRWLVMPDGGSTPEQRRLREFVEMRNDLAHGRAGRSRQGAGELALVMARHVRGILDSLAWLPAWRLFRVVDRHLDADQCYSGHLQVFAGALPAPDARRLRWRGTVADGRVYLLDPTGREALDLSPFVAFGPVGPGGEGLFVLRERVRDQVMVAVHEGTGATMSISSHDFEAGPRPDPEGLGQSWRLQRLEALDTDLAAPPPAPAAEGPWPWGLEWVRELGRGGMAEVHEVRDLGLERSFAFKVLSRELAADEDFVRRFVREGRTLARLAHPRLLAVHELGYLGDGRPYLKLELASGGDLRRASLGGPLDPDLVEAWAEDLLEGLSALHAEDIVHRDIKPSNLLEDGEGRLLIGDLGIALAPDDERMTRSVEQLGSVAYMAPEQRGRRRPDPRADIYSAAVVLDELLSGELRPAPGKGVGGRLGALLRRMGAQDPDQRPGADQALAFLRGEAAGAGLRDATRGSGGPRPTPELARPEQAAEAPGTAPRRFWSGLLLVFVAVALLFAWRAWGSSASASCAPEVFEGTTWTVRTVVTLPEKWTDRSGGVYRWETRCDQDVVVVRATKLGYHQDGAWKAERSEKIGVGRAVAAGRGAYAASLRADVGSKFLSMEVGFVLEGDRLLGRWEHGYSGLMEAVRGAPAVIGAEPPASALELSRFSCVEACRLHCLGDGEASSVRGGDDPGRACVDGCRSGSVRPLRCGVPGAGL